MNYVSLKHSFVLNQHAAVCIGMSPLSVPETIRIADLCSLMQINPTITTGNANYLKSRSVYYLLCYVIYFPYEDIEMVLVVSPSRLLFSTVLCNTVLVLNLKTVQGHPQCLDFRAPFQVTAGLSFCPQNYSDYGCCSPNRDQRISNEYTKLSSQFSLDNKPKCANLVKTILCLECHRYAAHIYEAETNENFDSATATPGLCLDFCKNFYQECSDVAKHFVSTGKWKLRFSSNTTASPAGILTENSLCEGLKLDDTDYCFPHVETVDQNDLAKKYNYDSNQQCLCVEEIASGLRNPLAAVHAGDESGRLFIAEQPGVIRIISAKGKLLKQPFLDITDRVLTSGSFGDERGFLSIAFHPEFKRNNRFFVYYSSRLRRKSGGFRKKAPFLAFDHVTVLSEFRASVYNRNRGLRRSETVILEVDQPADNHNGGMILFGSDGLLYLTLGDGGRAGDPFGKIGNGLNRSVYRTERLSCLMTINL